MATTIKWQHWSTGWTEPASDPDSDIVCIGPEDGNKRQRSCITVNLDALSAEEKRDKLEISLSATVASRFGSSSGNDTIYARMTDEGPNKPYYSIQGSTLSTKSCNVDHSNSDIYPSWTFDISSFSKSAKTIYIYIYGSTVGDGIYGQYKIYEGSVEEETASDAPDVPDVTAVTTGSISTAGGQFFAPTQDITFSWENGSDGINNTISGYSTCISYYLNNEYKETTPNTVKTTSTNCTIPNADRGSEITAWVKALGTANLNGEWESKVIGKINEKPTITNVTSTGTKITDTDSITFTGALSSNDTNQNVYLEYQLNTNGWERIPDSGKSLTLKKGSAGLNTDKPSNSIKFRANDGVEIAEYGTTFNFNTSYKPVLSSPNIGFSQVKDMFGSVESKLTRIITGTYSCSDTVSVIAQIRVNSSDSFSDSLTPQDVSTAIISSTKGKFEVDISKISSSTLSYGHYFQIRFAVSSGGGTSEFTGWYGSRRRPKLPKLPTGISYSNQAVNNYGTAKNNYFETKIKITATNPTIEAGYAQIDSISLILNGDTVQPLEWNSSQSGSQNREYNLEERVNKGATASFQFIVTDIAGQTNTTSTFGNLIRSNGLAFQAQGGTEPAAPGVNPYNIRPLVNTQNFIIRHAYASDIGSTFSYRYKISLNNSTGYITPSSTDNTDIYENTVTFNSSVINSFLLDKVPENERDDNYKATLTVFAVNGFGTSVFLPEVTFYANFMEPPVFNSSNFKIGHDFNINNSSASSLINEVTSTLATNHLNRMFNFKEGIIFALPKATDPNDDFIGYNIYLTRQDMILNGTAPSYDSIKFSNKPWLFISKEGLLSNTYYYFYRHSMSQLAKNEYLYFQVKAVDSTGLESEQSKVFQSYLIGCRTQPANFNVETKISRGSNKVTIGYKIKITDIGGSAPASGWNESFYNAYKNFERSISGYNKEIDVKVEFSDNPNFTNAQVLVLPTSMVGKNLLDYTGHSPDGDGYSSVSFNTSGEVSKIYVRFTLYVSYTLQSSATAYITSSSKVDTNFGEVPTVSHRAHRVGINTNSVDDESVFVVENYGSSRKKIKFIGADSQNASIVYTIEFDLSTGTIKGTKIDNFVIDGGTW